MGAASFRCRKGSFFDANRVLFLPLAVVCGLFGVELVLIQKASGSVWPFLAVCVFAYAITYLLFRARFREGSGS